MKLKFAICLILIPLIFLTGCVSAKITPEIPVSEETMFLWELEHSRGTLYFLGSFHLATADVYPLDEQMYKAYEDSGTLVVELDITDETTLASIQVLTMQMGMFQGDETLEDHLSPELYKKIVSVMEATAIPMNAAVKFKPWLLSLLISLPQMENLGFKQELGIDHHFLNRASEDGKEIKSLETPKEQMNIIAGAPMDMQIYSLESSIDEIENIPDILDNLLSTWKEGDVEKFADYMFEDLTENPYGEILNDWMITRRNRNWVLKIEEWIEAGGNYFIIAGAGHMVGEDSVIELLREKGYNLHQY